MGLINTYCYFLTLFIIIMISETDCTHEDAQIRKKCSPTQEQIKCPLTGSSGLSGGTIMHSFYDQNVHNIYKPKILESDESELVRAY